MVNIILSDLFFNHDNSDAFNEEGELDNAQLLQNAEDFLVMLDELGVVELPTARELCEDFWERL